MRRGTDCDAASDVEARGPDDFDHAFAAMVREPADALVVAGSSTFLVHRTRLAELAAKRRLPAIYSYRENVAVRGLMAYAAHVADFIGRAAVYVDKILHGAKPADLPVEQPTRLELVVNLRAAKAIGLTVPRSLLLRAGELGGNNRADQHRRFSDAGSSPGIAAHAPTAACRRSPPSPHPRRSGRCP